MSVRVAVRPNAGRNAPRYFGMPAAAGIIKTLPDSLTGYRPSRNAFRHWAACPVGTPKVRRTA